MKINSQHYLTLRKLVNFSSSIADLTHELSLLNYDEEKVYLIDSMSIIKVLDLYIKGSRTNEEIESWANLIELREDLYYEKERYAEIEEAINILANPILFGSLTHLVAQSLIDKLEK